MLDVKLQRLEAVMNIFEHELSLKRTSLKRATKKALDEGYPRSVVNEVIDFLILQGRIPQDTERADVYAESIAA